MNRKKTNGSKKTNDTSFIKKDNDLNSNSTDSFDMNDFKSSSLNQKYSVQVHKNKADLMAELSSINIMGDESDVEIVEQRTETNRLNTSACASDKNSSNVISVNSSHSTDVRSNGDFDNDKQERILSWAQSQSQNLSMCVESILSDHDYLSQQSLIGLVSGNEIQSQREINGNVSSNELGEQNGVLEKMEHQIGTNEPSKIKKNNESFSENNIEDLDAILKKLLDKKEKSQRLAMLAEIEEKTKIMRAELTENEQNKTNGDTEQLDAQGGSDNITPEFSSNHSEPMEYYNVKFASDSSTDPVKDTEGTTDLISEINRDLKLAAEMGNRISCDVKSIQKSVTEIEKDSEAERTKSIEKFRINVGLLLDDVAKELNKIAIKLNPNLIPGKVDTATQKTPEKKSKSRVVSDSTDEDNYSESHRKSRKLKRRRKTRLNHSDISDSMKKSSSSEEYLSDKNALNNIKDEPFVISQNIDDLINGTGSNSANESIRKENDFLGFDDDIEIGIKTELNNSEPTFSSQKDTSQNAMEVSKEASSIEDDESTQIINFDHSPEQKISSKKGTDYSSSTGSLSDQNMFDNDDDDDDDDEDIRKLLDLKSLDNKRVASTHSAAKVNGIVELKKPNKKASKEDELSKFLARNSDDTEKTVESEEEKSDAEEVTEEQFLKEQNEMLKEQLLQDSSESDGDFNDSDSDRRINGEGSDFDDNSDFDSGQSLVEQFLASESRNTSPIAKDEAEPKQSKETASREKQSDSKAKEQSSEHSDIKKNEPIIDDEMDSDIEFDSDAGSLSLSDAPKKSKSTVGKNLFSNIEKDNRIVIPSDEEMSGSETEKKKSSSKEKSEIESSAKDAAVLDTTMFQTNKKDLNAQQLHKKLQLQSNRNKQTTSRHSPTDYISLSSDDDSEIESTSIEKKDGKEDDEEEKEKRVKRKLLRDDQLADDTKLAQKEESDRIKRLDKKNERLSQFMQSQRESQEEDSESHSQSQGPSQDDPNEVLLDYDTKKKEKIVVHREITKHLKPHQREGIKFMYDCCYGSADTLDKHPGSGCILAHCMGLGKTLQLITLLHTVISYPQLKTDKVLVICPKSTVMNWKDEIERWLSPIKNSRRLKLFHFPESCDVNAKLRTLQQWSQCGTKDNKQAGCLLLGYEAFRVLVFYHKSKKSKQMYSEHELDRLGKSIHKYLLDPGADLVVCDEGHMIKNQKSTTSLAVNQISTKRRIVLTGTPIQNNLKEYYSMVNFIKPSFLGTEKEFANLYVNPIKNGQHKDSSKSEIKYMKQRSYVLHKKLSRFVQRKEAALLKSFLPHKYEYVLFIPMTDVQTTLYEYFLENRPNQDQKGKSLIPDYTVLRKIWTHPKVLENAYLNALQNKTKVKQITAAPANDSDDDQPDDVFDSQTGDMSVTNDWWRSHLAKEDLETILPSNKLKILFEILNQCWRNKEKCLIFSAFVAVLDVVEFFMRLINEQEKVGNKPGLETFRGPYELGRDYYRLDGKTAKTQRHSMITSFNDPKNDRIRVFLISAKAGGQGINLIGANRVILLDTSWNPSNDQQNIFRVFRLGQKKICYIYRLISMGTMEEKVYSRSVTKQAMSCRVMDEQQIDRHYNMADLTDLYILTKPDMDKRPIPNVPKDDVLAHLLMNFPKMVYKYHEHDSLLECKSEEELSEQEKNDAWLAYEADVKRKNDTNMGPYNNSFGMLPNYSSGMGYANSLFNSYNNLSGVGGMNYPYNMYGQYNPYSSDYNQMRFSDYSAFYNNLMNMNGSSISNYNQSNSNLMSSNHSSSVSSPPPSLLNSFTSSRNWMPPNASSSNYANSLLSSFAQSSSTSKSSNLNYSSYLNSIYNALGTNTAATSSTSANLSKSPPLPLSSSDLNALAYFQKQQLSGIAGSSNPITSTSPLGSGSSTSSSGTGAQQGPNARRNPLLTKELLIPRNPSTSKDMFNLPIPTSVITKTTMSSSSSTSSNITSSAGGPNQNDGSKLASKSPDTIISSSLDKTGTKTPKSSTETQITVKNVATINNESRSSPDTTGQLAQNKTVDKTSVNNGVSSTVTGSIDSTKKNKQSTNVTPNSSNIGIVYPPSKPIQTASSSKSSPNLIRLKTNATSDKPPTAGSSISTTANVLNKSNQPMPSIIRKPIQLSTSKTSDATSDAVTAITKNKELTVTPRHVTVSTAKVLPVTGVSNSITLSPIPASTSNSTKFIGGGVSITPQAKINITSQGRTISPISKGNAPSPVPIALTKTTVNQSINSKSPTPVAKPNVLSSRNTNTNKIIISTPKTPSSSSPIPTGTRILNNNLGVAPKIVVPRASPSQTTKPFIVAQTKAQLSAAQASSNKQTANNSTVQVNRVLTARPRQVEKTSSLRPKIVTTRTNAMPTESRKRLANETITIDTAKKPKSTINSTPIASSSSVSGTKTPNSLEGLRLINKPLLQQVNSQKPPVPMEIVELE